MRTILVVCAAGASSSFLVHWMRREASNRGLDLRIDATSCDDRQLDLIGVDTVLVSHHVEDRFESIRERADAARARALVLPPVSFDQHGAVTALEFALAGTDAALPSDRSTIDDTTHAR